MNDDHAAALAGLTPTQIAVLVAMRRTGGLTPASAPSHTLAALVAGGWVSLRHRLTIPGARAADVWLGHFGTALDRQRRIAHRTAVEQARP